MHKRINCFISRANRALRFMFFVGLALTICFSSSIARALTEEELDRYAAYGIRFYNPSCTGGSVDGSKMTYIGDSLSESVYDSVKGIYKGIDGEKKEYDGTTYNLIQVGKQFSGNSSGPNHDGITIATKLKDKKELREYLIFALGTNGPGGVTDSVLESLGKAVGDSTKVLLVTNFGTKEDSKSGYSKNNKAMKDYASKHNNFTVADWNATAASDPSKYINNSDGLGVHLTKDGQKAFVDLLKDSITAAWGGSGGSSGAAAGNGTNKNYAGDEVFSSDEMKKIEENKPFYEAAAQKYGFKWQLLAAIHSMENSLKRTNDSNGQGAYQLYSYTNGGKNSNAFLPAGSITDAEFTRQTDIASSFIIQKAKDVGADFTTDDGIKKLLFGYNGMSDKYKKKALAMGFSQEEANNGEGSQYVMNRFDARRDPTSSQMDKNWPGLYVSDLNYSATATSKRFGAYVRYVALGGSGDNSCEEDNDFLAYVKKYVWPEYKGKPFLERMPDYADAVEERNKNGLFVGSTHGVLGIDCGGFVTTLVVNSGLDPDYNKNNSGISSGQLPYLKANQDKWEIVNPDWNTEIKDESVLTPGDVAFVECNSTPYDHCKHTYIYIGEVDGYEYHIASASFSEYDNGRAPMAGREGIIKYDGDRVVWFHRK